MLHRPSDLIRRPARRALDALSARVVAGLRPEVVAMLATARAAEAPVFFTDINELLHAQRSVELARMPKGAEVFLSAGCAGRWYFDWIEQEYGHLRRHIGVERYMSRPDGLPTNVEWISASVANMQPVEDASVDLLFSGQNFEHLFGDDTVGFLLESARVLRAGGHLVIDSPHRELTRLLGWSHPQHTIEFTPGEAAELVEMAGFDVTALRGIWIVRDPDTGTMLPLDPFGVPVPPAEIVRRIQLASRFPEHSFIWWIEAVRSTREPAAEVLRRRHGEIFASAWPERTNRLRTVVGTVREDGGVRIAAASAGTVGLLVDGPGMPLAAAQYGVTVHLRGATGKLRPGEVVATIQVSVDGGATVVTTHEVRAADLPAGTWGDITVTFELPELRWEAQFGITTRGVCDLEARLDIELSDHGSPVWPSRLRESVALTG